MLGNNVQVILTMGEIVNGELRKQTVEGVWIYFGWAEQAAVHFYPQHRIMEIIDRGRINR
jgi:hypothetical protein